jgi:hypothetical protein
VVCVRVTSGVVGVARFFFALGISIVQVSEEDFDIGVTNSQDVLFCFLLSKESRFSCTLLLRRISNKGLFVEIKKVLFSGTIISKPLCKRLKHIRFGHEINSRWCCLREGNITFLENNGRFLKQFFFLNP